MAERKEIGKIKRISFGFGGYQDVMIGISFVLGGESWGVNDFSGAWATERTDRAQWTEDDRLRQLGETCMLARKLMTDAQVTSLEDLMDAPIEATFEGMRLKSWRILTEAI